MTNRFCIFLVFTLLLFASACSLEKSDTSAQPYASVSVYAMVPDAPQLNVFLNGNNIAAGVPFGSFTLYNQVSPGTAVLQARTSTESTTVDTSFSTTENKYYSVFLTGSLAAITPVLIQDSLGSIDSGYVNLRFLNFSPNVSSIDIHAFNTTDRITKIIWKNRSFSDNIANDTINRFIPFERGTYNFYAVKTNSTDTIASFTNKSFTTAANYTLMLEGLYNSAKEENTLQLGTRLHQ